jgi:hypothetical protein
LKGTVEAEKLGISAHNLPPSPEFLPIPQDVTGPLHMGLLGAETKVADGL